MTNEQFEQLLYEEESPTLDFKQGQYAFAKATEEQKAELLKDIAGFANAWRRSEAYIIIGVEDVRGGRGIVHGIQEPEHLPDHSLQQFVNNLTNQPVRFHYEATRFEGKHVGIIRIEEQTRPIYLRRDYGGLAKEQVYIRRGSSTDPSKPARPEEIALMRAGSGQQSAELRVEFAGVGRDDPLGASISWDAEYWEVPSMHEIPDLRGRNTGPFEFAVSSPYRPNKDYYRELAHYEFVRRLFRPVRLVIENIGSVAARDVRLEIDIPKDIGVVAMEASELPDPPKREQHYFDLSARLPLMRPIVREQGDVEIDENDHRFRVAVDCGDLQPSRRVWSDVFYLGIGDNGTAVLPGLIYADNLPRAKKFSLLIASTIVRTTVTLNDLRNMPEPVDPSR